ncbi:MAG: Stp1/IreP family PP2C-type Ser/Thr phosphatase [Clostridiales bacterium]|nr:Stp1/IreP family PP2C-type Ser/Thr phosphatase [Clostridiales bacterium]
MIAISRTDPGKVRPSNQDALLQTAGPYALFAVADGMGGHRGGNIASAMAVDCLSEIDNQSPPEEEALKAAFDRANRLIWERQRQDENLSGMGTTLTALWEGADYVLLGHVGDSRAYLYRDGVLRQMSADHSLVGELLRSGMLNSEDARTYPYRNIVTRAVGTDQALESDIARVDKLPGDRWLLCSDGLTEYASQEAITRAMALALSEAAEQLMALALSGGGRDNITLMFLEVPA